MFAFRPPVPAYRHDAAMFLEPGARDRLAELGVDRCHGYLLHELLAGRDRPGPFGGDLEGRTRFPRGVLACIRREAPGFAVAVRLSAFDFVPYRQGEDGVDEPEPDGPPRGTAEPGLLPTARPGRIEVHLPEPSGVLHDTKRTAGVPGVEVLGVGLTEPGAHRASDADAGRRRPRGGATG